MDKLIVKTMIFLLSQVTANTAYFVEAQRLLKEWKKREEPRWAK